MKKPVLVCAADIAHLPETRAILEEAFELRVARPATPEALARALPEADAYFAALETRLTDELLASAPRLKAVATPRRGSTIWMWRPPPAARTAHELIAGQPVTMADGGRLNLSFQPYQSRVFALEKTE